MRRYRMRPNHSAAGPSHIISFDAETLPKRYGKKRGQELHTLRLGVAKYVRIEDGKLTRRDSLRFVTPATFWEWVRSKQHPRMPLWIFAHNVAFDITVVEFWALMQKGEYKTAQQSESEGVEQKSDFGKGYGKGFLLLEDPPTVLSLVHESGSKVVIVDTMNYFTTSLAKMGDMLGLPKMKMPKWKASDEEWFRYCENDVEITERCVLGLIQWVKENDMGKFRYTAPSQALAAFRHQFMDIAPECHMEPDVRALERKAYYGGRLENFYIGKVDRRPVKRSRRRSSSVSHSDGTQVGPVYELDVASLYPFVMSENHYPFQLVSSSFEDGVPEEWSTVLAGDCVAEVLLRTTEQYPFRHDSIGTIYPVGEYWTTLCGPELQRALDCGHVHAVRNFSRYRLADLFSGFVSGLWERRHHYEATGNTLYAGLCKLLMVSLYGKFGQLGTEWKERPAMEPPTDWGQWAIVGRLSGVSRTFRVIGGLVQERIEKDEIQAAFPAIAAYVTAYGREYMRELREIAGRENVYYLVTDALYVNQNGFDRLNAAGYIQDRTLGKLTVKHVGDSAEFECLHHLRVGDYVKRGSVKSRAVQTGPNQWEEIHFQGLRSIIAGRKELVRTVDPHTGETTFSEVVLPPLPGVLTFPLVKTFSKQYTRGFRQPDGWVSPLVLTMDGEKENENASSLPVASIPTVSVSKARDNGNRRRKGRRKTR